MLKEKKKDEVISTFSFFYLPLRLHIRVRGRCGIIDFHLSDDLLPQAMQIRTCDPHIGLPQHAGYPVLGCVRKPERPGIKTRMLITAPFIPT